MSTGHCRNKKYTFYIDHVSLLFKLVSSIKTTFLTYYWAQNRLVGPDHFMHSTVQLQLFTSPHKLVAVIIQQIYKTITMYILTVIIIQRQTTISRLTSTLQKKIQLKVN